MSISSYEFLSIIQAKQNARAAHGEGSFDYPAVLESVRISIAANNAQELSAALDDEAAAKALKSLIMKYATEYMAGKEYNREALVERIYEDMAGLGILTKYLYDPTVEEININDYRNIEIIRPDRTEYLCDDKAFSSPVAELDIVKRMVRMGGMLLDAQTPRVDSFIGNGTRISAVSPPITPPEQGVIVSIRKQNKNRITRQQLIDSGTATADMLDFLTACLCYGVSIGTAGGTGSGKSTLMAYLLNSYIRNNEDNNNRIYIIEDSRELNLLDYDDIHNRPARVLYTLTKPEPNPVSMFDLIVSSLRFHPALIVPAEVRDGAAYQAAIAGQTGHTILTSFHADGAKDAYNRLVALCNMAGTTLPTDRILNMCIGAWPIMIFQKQLKDNSRRITEVFEATGCIGSDIAGNYLFRFITDGTERDENGHITRISGHHEKVDEISETLFRRMLDNGAPQDLLKRLFPDTAKLVIPEKTAKRPTPKKAVTKTAAKASVKATEGEAAGIEAAENKPKPATRTRTKAASKPKEPPAEEKEQGEVS